MEKEQNNIAKALADCFVATLECFTNTIWTRCKDKESESGHDFTHGPILSKEEGRTAVIFSICKYCGKIKQDEISGLTNMLGFRMQGQQDTSLQ